MSQDHVLYTQLIGDLVAARIDELRVQRHVSVNWLADFSGLDRGYVSRALRGKGNPSVRTLALLANALDVPIGSLFAFVEPARPGPKAAARRRSATSITESDESDPA